MFEKQGRVMITRITIAAIILFALPICAQEADSSFVAAKRQKLEMSGQYAPKYYVVTPFAIQGDASALRLRKTLIARVAREVDKEAEGWGGARHISVSPEAMESLERALSWFSHFSSVTIKRELDNTVVPAFADAISGIARPAAEDLLDEQQKHSFIADKAKQSAVTTSEMGVVRNCGYIFVPWINNYSEYKEKDFWHCNIGVGFLIYSIKDIDGRWESWLEGTPYDKSLLVPGSQCFDSAFADAVSNAVSGCFTLLAPTFSDFNVTSQVLEPGFNSVNFSLPCTQKHWLSVDTRVSFIKLETESDGSVKRKNNGWGLVIKPTGGFSDNDPKYKAQVIAGFPSMGTIVEEIKTRGGDADIGWSIMPFKLHTTHDSLSNYSAAPTVTIDHLSSSRTTLQMPQLLTFGFPIGKNNPALRQTYINLDLSLMVFSQDINAGTVVEKKTAVSAPDTVMSKGNALWLGIGLGASKRLYFRRCAIKPFFNARFGTADYTFAAQKSIDTINIIFGIPMLSAGSDVEFALFPDASIGVSFWYCRAFPFVWSMFFNGSNDPVYPHSQTGEFAPNIEGLGYTFHLTLLF